MNWILKNKNKKAKASLIVLFLVFGFAFFIQDAKAEVCKDTLSELLKLKPSGTCLISVNPGVYCEAKDSAECQAMCAAKQVKGGTCQFSPAGNTGDPSKMIESKGEKETPSLLGGVFTDAIKFILTQIQLLVGWLFAIAATLFSWAIDPANISGEFGLLDKQAVKDVWTMVRDLLNMTFILVLLFAAFCTIFQVDKWNLKKVWLNILINALLVNFSYPIARFFIDISNVAFYYFVNNLFSSAGAVTGSSIMAMFGSSSTIGSILKPEAFTADPIAYQIAMIVFIFIMGMTLLIVAGLFLIRLIALTMLVMFSPIGFVGYIFPETQKYANDWWSQLFSYSFFAPIMIFGIAISLRIAEALKAENIRPMMASASANSPAEQIQWISDMAFYFIPVIILWMFIGVAKKAGIAGADSVVGAVKKGGKSLAMGLSGANYLKKNYAAFAGARKKRAEELDKKRWGSSLGDKANDAQDRLIAGGGLTKKQREAAQKRFDKRKDTKNKDDIKDATSNHDSTTEAVLYRNLSNMDPASLAAMSDKDAIDAAGQVRQALSRGARYEKEVENNIKAGADAAGFSVNAAVITAGMTAGEIDIENKREKKEREDRDRWVQHEKTKHMDQARAVIKEAEDRGKIKKSPAPPPPAPHPPAPTP